MDDKTKHSEYLCVNIPVSGKVFHKAVERIGNSESEQSCQIASWLSWTLRLCQSACGCLCFPDMFSLLIPRCLRIMLIPRVVPKGT